MTVRIQLIASDDLDEAEKDLITDIGEDGEAITFSVDGIVREIHLTAPHAIEFRSFMQRYIDAGHEPGAAPLPLDAPREPYRPGGQGRRQEIPGTREFLQWVRDWAADRDITIPEAGAKGKHNYKYTDDLKLQVVAYLFEAVARNGRDAAAKARLAFARQFWADSLARIAARYPPPGPDWAQ